MYTCVYMERKHATGVFALFGNKPFMILWIGQILSQISSNMILYLLAVVVYKATGSNTAVSGLYMAFGIPSVIFGVLAGAIVDHLDRRKVIIASGILRALLVGLLPFVTANTGVVYLVLFLSAVISQFYLPAEAPLIPQYVKERELVTANSLFSFAFYSSMALGFVFAGPTLRLLGDTGSFLFIAALFILSSWISVLLPINKESDRDLSRFLRYDFIEGIRKISGSIADGIAYVSGSKTLAECLLLLTGTQIIFAILGTLAPGFADRVMGIDIRDASVIIVGPVVGGVLLGSLWVGNFGFRYNRSKLINTGIISAGITLVIVSIVIYLKRFTNFHFLFEDQIIVPLVITLFFLLGIANSLLDVPANAMLQDQAEGDMRGRVYGVLSAAVGGIGILPVLLGGILADAIGVGKVISLLGTIIALYGIFRVRYRKSITQ